MLKQLTAALWAANALCKTLEHCPAGGRLLIACIAIGGIVAIAYAVLARA
jgi:hypothetical protein